MSGLLPPPIPRPRPSFYVYGTIDISTDPVTLVRVDNSRSEARKKLEFDPEADHRRIRRGRLSLYES